jgi:hypothetical protein
VQSSGGADFTSRLLLPGPISAFLRHKHSPRVRVSSLAALAFIKPEFMSAERAVIPATLIKNHIKKQR